MNGPVGALRFSPEQYFDDLLPQCLAHKPQAKGVGICVVRLLGESGGEWTIDTGQRTVERGAASTPDFYLEMDRVDFLAMMGAELDVPHAIRDGRIRFDGDLRLLRILAALLDPAR